MQGVNILSPNKMVPNFLPRNAELNSSNLMVMRQIDLPDLRLMVLLLVMVTLLLFLMRRERRIERTKLSPYFMVRDKAVTC